MLFKSSAIRHRRIHFIGIGGIGMSGLAEILANLGYSVSGSDLRSSPITERLEGLGAEVHVGHDAKNLGDADAVVMSSAIPETNPELATARRRNIPVIPRGELLAELMRLKFGIAVGGSHGKTTTTSMAASVLHGAELDPTVVVGGRVDALDSNARLGNGEILLVESDESDGSFLRLAPIIAVVTSLDPEHLDHYGSYANLERAFVDFLNKVPFYGSAIVCMDDPNVRELVPQVTRTLRTYGLAEVSPEADLQASEIDYGHLRCSFDLSYRGEALGRFEVRGAGEHTVRNAMAAVLIALELQADVDAVRAGLAAYTGVDRRFQIRGESGGVTVLDDYGHHPVEIEATLGAARNCDFRRILVLFQPHRYSRTAALADEFARCFRDSDQLFVLDIYSAGEQPIEGVNGLALSDRIRAESSFPVEYVGSMDAGVRAAVAAARPGDVIVTLGAGNVSQAGPALLELLASRASAVAEA